jgi:hypothetical protein
LIEECDEEENVEELELLLSVLIVVGITSIRFGTAVVMHVVIIFLQLMIYT